MFQVLRLFVVCFLAVVIIFTANAVAQSATYGTTAEKIRAEGQARKIEAIATQYFGDKQDELQAQKEAEFQEQDGAYAVSKGFFGEDAEREVARMAQLRTEARAGLKYKDRASEEARHQEGVAFEKIEKDFKEALFAANAKIGRETPTTSATTKADTDEAALERELKKAADESKCWDDKLHALEKINPKTATVHREWMKSLNKARLQSVKYHVGIINLKTAITDAPEKAAAKKAEAEKTEIENATLEKALVEARAKAKAEAIVRAENNIGNDYQPNTQLYFPYPVYIEEPVLVGGFYWWYGRRYAPWEMQYLHHRHAQYMQHEGGGSGAAHHASRR